MPRKLLFALALLALPLQADPCCRPLPLSEALRELPRGEAERSLRIDLDGDGVGEEVKLVRLSEPGVVSLFEARIEADVDGDGVRDPILFDSGSGSGMSSAHVELVFSRSGKRIEVASDFSFTSMVNPTEVPAELEAPGMERALRLVEAALFGCVCESPDPSLAWLLEKEPRSIRWVAGPPSLPDAYTVRQADDWLSYAGGTHRGLVRKAPGPEIMPFATDPQTGHVLAHTAHGVLLIDEKGSRHAWLYVTLDGEGQKLRFPTVVGGRLEGREAVVRLSHEMAFYGTYGCGLLRIRLDDGTRSERWRELDDSVKADMEACWAGLEKDAGPAPHTPIP